jgi:DNA-binding response OmpR family regulator
MSGKPVVVAVMNTSPDTIQLLRTPLEKAGFTVVSAMTYELRDGVVDLESFVRQHDPKVVVYDVAPPYEANWRLFEHLSSASVLRSAFFVVTTTNVAQLRKVAGSDQDLHEIVGKPLDLEEVVSAVVEAAHQRPVRQRAP